MEPSGDFLWEPFAFAGMMTTAMSDPTDNSQGTSPPGAASGWVGKLVVGVLVLAAVIVGVTLFGETLTLSNLAAREADLRAYGQAHPVLIYGVAFLIYVAVTGLSLPGAAGMTLIIGWFFGFRDGVILVSFASTTGATLAFLFSRYLLRDVIQRKFGDRLRKFNEALEREGALYLFTLRLIPVVPFFVINLVMGLTPIRTATFWWVSQVGMLAGTMVFVYAGSSVPDLQTLADKGASGILSIQLFIAFALLGLFPITVKKIMGRLRRSEI